MSKEYIIVSGGTVLGDCGQAGPARRMAEDAARGQVGAEVALYQRVNIYKARVIVEDDAPKALSAEEAR